MDQIRRMVATILKYLGQMQKGQQLQIASIAIIVGLVLVLVWIVSSQKTYVELLPGVAIESQQTSSAFLTASGISNEMRAGKLMVPAEKEGVARAMLAENGKLPSDKTILFNNLLEKQSWINSRQQNEQIVTIALQNQLASDISNFRGIKSASVILDIPEASGIGRAVRKPTASATVSTRDGSPLPQSTVNAIAGYIAGSRAGLEIERVRVIDAVMGTQRRATGESEMVSSSYLEHAAKVEASTRDKITESLGYIPGVNVIVTAQVDVTRVNSDTKMFLPTGQGTISEIKNTTEDETKSSQASGSAEPGFGANVSADINRGKSGSPGNSSSTTKTESEFEILPGMKNETVMDPRGMPTMVAVSVSVPYGFVEALAAKSAAGAAGAAPAGGTGTTPSAVTEADVNKAFDQSIKPRIEAAIRPHVLAMSTAAKGSAQADVDRMMQQAISVQMVPMDLPKVASAQTAGMFGGGPGGMLSLGSGLLDKAVLGGLAVMAVGMMFMLVKKSGKKAAMPTVEELVGVPPELEAPSDVIGDALEGDSPLAGIEVGEDEVQSQKLLEQVGDLVKESPDTAAQLLNRWIQTQE
jgi:flagellar biosynthesis/type III secretory pathway M-ring protein FliF/YscJ